MVEYRMEKTDITGPTFPEEDAQGHFPTLPGLSFFNVLLFSGGEPETLSGQDESSRLLKRYKAMFCPFHCSHHLQARP
jgi:hypothetical protein